jgi:MFS family permease
VSGARSIDKLTDRPCIDCLDESTTAQRARRVAPRPIAFWLVAYVFAVSMLGTTLPTPLYVIYQAQWHFSSGIVTTIFATYAVGVLVALLFAGRASDQVGRKPVLATALGLSAASTVVFIIAPSLGWLFIGRILSGLSAGLMTGTATATLTDLTSRTPRASLIATAANMGGLGLGPLTAGLFSQYLPRPTVLVFEAYLFLLATAAIGLALVPETVTSRAKLTLRFNRLELPPSGRSEFVAAAVAGFAAFSLLGLFTSLAPSFLGQVIHERSHAVGGLMVFLLFAAGAATQLTLVRWPSRLVIRIGLFLFLAALALVVAALSEAIFWLFVLATVLGGIAVGAVFLGSLSTANRLAPPEKRAQVVSTYFVFCYVGVIIPVIGVGVATEHVGDFRAVLGGAIVLAVLSLLSLAIFGGRRPRFRSRAAGRSSALQRSED